MGSERGASLWTARGLTPLFPSPRVRRAKSPLPRKATQRLSSARRIPRFRPLLLRKAKAESSLRSPKPRGTHAPLSLGRLPAFGLTFNHALPSGSGRSAPLAAIACSRRREEAGVLNCGLRIGRSARLLTSSATVVGSMRRGASASRGRFQAPPWAPHKNVENMFVVWQRGKIFLPGEAHDLPANQGQRTDRNAETFRQSWQRAGPGHGGVAEENEVVQER